MFEDINFVDFLFYILITGAILFAYTLGSMRSGRWKGIKRGVAEEEIPPFPPYAPMPNPNEELVNSSFHGAEKTVTKRLAAATLNYVKAFGKVTKPQLMYMLHLSEQQLNKILNLLQSRGLIAVRDVTTADSVLLTIVEYKGEGSEKI